MYRRHPLADERVFNNRPAPKMKPKSSGSKDGDVRTYYASKSEVGGRIAALRGNRRTGFAW